MDTPVVFFYYHPKLGPEFMRRLYSEMDVTIARDYRQPIDWLAAGKFAVCIPCNTRETEKAIKQGLPLGDSRAEGRRHVERRRGYRQLHR